MPFETVLKSFEEGIMFPETKNSQQNKQAEPVRCACEARKLKQAEEGLAEARMYLARFRKHTDETKRRDKAREFAACLLEEAIGADDSRLEGPIARVEFEGGNAWVSCQVLIHGV